MSKSFKGSNNVIQSLMAPRLHGLGDQKPGTEVRYGDEVIGTVDCVVDGDVVVKLKPGCEDKFLQLINNPDVHVSIGNLNSKAGHKS